MNSHTLCIDILCYKSYKKAYEIVKENEKCKRKEKNNEKMELLCMS